MRFSIAFRAALALALFLAASQVQAQSFTTYELDRYYRGGAYNSFDGMPYTQRYGYRLDAGYLQFGHTTHNLIMMDYYDRLDRAEKFGYCPPRDPYCDPAATPSGWHYGAGFRLFRR
jgi:hypothetical protein